MTREEQLGWEKRFGVYAAVAAFGSALAGAAGIALLTSLQTKQPISDTVDVLMAYHKNPNQYIAAEVLQGISIALLSGVLWYLYTVTRYRRPEIPAPLRYLAIALPVVVGILTIVGGVEQLNTAHKVSRALLSHPLFPKAANKFAEHETLHGTGAVVGYVVSAAALALAFTIGMVSVNARRAGVLSGFMGILGVIVGALLVIGGFLGMPPIVQYFWVTALGLLFLNRWPGQKGRGPAWESGEAEPWPTAAELRAAQQGAGGGGGGRGGGRATPPPREQRARRREPAPVEVEEEEAYEDEDAPAGTPHPRSKKRKRKRRR